jgi:hypothetical protein
MGDLGSKNSFTKYAINNRPALLYTPFTLPDATFSFLKGILGENEGFWKGYEVYCKPCLCRQAGVKTVNTNSSFAINPRINLWVNENHTFFLEQF